METWKHRKPGFGQRQKKRREISSRSFIEQHSKIGRSRNRCDRHSGRRGSQTRRRNSGNAGILPATDIYADKTFHFDVDRYSTTDFAGSGAGDTAGLTYGIGDKDGAFGRTPKSVTITSPIRAKISANRCFSTPKLSCITTQPRACALWADYGWRAIPTTRWFPIPATCWRPKRSISGAFHLGVAHAFSDNNLAPTPTRLLAVGLRSLADFQIFVRRRLLQRQIAHQRRAPTLYYSVNDKASLALATFSTTKRAARATPTSLPVFRYNFGGPKVAPAPEGAPGAPGP